MLYPVAPSELEACCTAEVPGAVGTCTPRAKPSVSHSLVTPCHRPSAVPLASTRSQPLMRGHSARVGLCVAVAVPGTHCGQMKLASPLVHGLPTEPPPVVPHAASPK